jgi:protoheme ferro-lyase
MGFDLYGLKPKLKSKEPNINWDKKPTEKERNEYFKAREKFEEENPGHYFRNNVWWWRPLAQYVLQLMGNEFTEDEKASWHHNDGFEVSEEQARKIADRLEQELKTKRVKTVENFYKARMLRAEQHNKIVEQKHEELKKIVAEKTGKTNLVPRDYPEPFNSQWDDIQKQFNYESSYPFSEDNVIEFMRFCRESGGFQIC